jgi:hypothetical protein
LFFFASVNRLHPSYEFSRGVPAFNIVEHALLVFTPGPPKRRLLKTAHMDVVALRFKGKLSPSSPKFGMQLGPFSADSVHRNDRVAWQCHCSRSKGGTRIGTINVKYTTYLIRLWVLEVTHMLSSLYYPRHTVKVW